MGLQNVRLIIHRSIHLGLCTQVSKLWWFSSLCGQVDIHLGRQQLVLLFYLLVLLLHLQVLFLHLRVLKLQQQEILLHLQIIRLYPRVLKLHLRVLRLQQLVLILHFRVLRIGKRVLLFILVSLGLSNKLCKQKKGQPFGYPCRF